MLKKIIFLLFNKNTPLFLKIIFFISLLYILSPVDFVSDFLPIAGWLDDLLLGIMWWLYLKGDKKDKKSKDNKGYLDLDEDDYRVE